MDTTFSSATPLADRRALVIGASVAGLPAARVLADHYDEVVVLERDKLTAVHSAKAMLHGKGGDVWEMMVENIP